MPTYTTGWTFVEDGDSKVYNTDDLVGTDTQNITNAQVQWEGVNVDRTETETSTNISSSSTTHFNGPEGTSANYPPVPSGYNFKNHFARYGEVTNNNNNDYDGTADFQYKYGDEFFDGTIASNSTINLGTGVGTTTNHVGESCVLTADFGNTTLDLYVKVLTTGEKTVTNTYNTENPSVSGDVSASGPTSLNDGEQSSWYSMSGLDAGVDETFNFSINGSNKAKFRFEFDYETATATPTYGTLSVQYGGTWYEIAIADSSDSQLESDELQVYVNGNWGVLDFVPETYSDGYTVDHIRVYNGTEWLKARAHNTRPA